MTWNWNFMSVIEFYWNRATLIHLHNGCFSEQPSWVVTTETLWPTEPEILLASPFQWKFADLYSGSLHVCLTLRISWPGVERKLTGIITAILFYESCLVRFSGGFVCVFPAGAGSLWKAGIPFPSVSRSTGVVLHCSRVTVSCRRLGVHSKLRSLWLTEVLWGFCPRLPSNVLINHEVCLQLLLISLPVNCLLGTVSWLCSTDLVGIVSLSRWCLYVKCPQSGDRV